jgi:hypothetical protein
MKKAKAKKSGTPAKKEDSGAEVPAASSKEVGTPDEPPADEENEDTNPISDLQPSTTSLAEQSKARSTSFRKTSISGPLSPGLFSPDGETAPDIYRKHVARIEELEKENKRLAKETADAEKRWQKAEEELADLRESDADAGKGAGGLGGEMEKLVRTP